MKQVTKREVDEKEREEWWDSLSALVSYIYILCSEWYENCLGESKYHPSVKLVDEINEWIFKSIGQPILPNVSFN